MSSSSRSSSTDLALLILRLGYAALLIGLHGWARSTRAYNYMFHGTPWTFVDLVGRIGFPFPAVFAVLSVASEFIGSLLMLAGLFTRWASFAIAFNFAVALYSETSKGDPFELPGLYFLGAIVLMIAGAGAYSLDEKIGGRSGRGRRL